MQSRVTPTLETNLTRMHKAFGHVSAGNRADHQSEPSTITEGYKDLYEILHPETKAVTGKDLVDKRWHTGAVSRAGIESEPSTITEPHKDVKPFVQEMLRSLAS